MKHAAAAIIAIAFLLVLNAGCLQLIPGFDGVAYPKIVPDRQGSMPGPVAYHFSFQDYPVTIDPLPIESAVYAGARNSDKSARIYDEGISEEEWLSGIYSSMIADPAQDSFFESLLAALRNVRDERRLDDDEYLELITVFVQSIRYENLDMTDPKYPIETYVDGWGDCDDKSMLLAGLLSREGYRISLMYFAPEMHMAVGIDCGDEGYKNTGYGYVETTNVTLVGVIPPHLQGDIVLSSDPLVVPVGCGNRTYNRCMETRAIWEELKETEKELRELQSAIEAMEIRLLEENEALELQRSDLDALLFAGNRKVYNRMVSSYNSGVWSYNELLQDYREKTEQYNTLAELYNYILSHQYDRRGTFQILFG